MGRYGSRWRREKWDAEIMWIWYLGIKSQNDLKHWTEIKNKKNKRRHSGHITTSDCNHCNTLPWITPDLTNTVKYLGVIIYRKINLLIRDMFHQVKTFEANTDDMFDTHERRRAMSLTSCTLSTSAHVRAHTNT